METGKIIPRTGSPPHTRGIPTCMKLRPPWRGITPAYTGNTQLSCRPCSRPRDHPRIHGEYATGQTNTFNWEGSPPHTRGIPRIIPGNVSFKRITPAYTGNTIESVKFNHFIRITPAYTGNTSRMRNLCSWLGDHLRIHGEY